MQASQPDKDLMFSLINKWKSSDISQKAFCEEHNIRYHVFHYWYKRFKNDTKTTSISSGHFIHLQPAANLSDTFAELILARGTKIIFHQPVSADYLKALL